MAVPDRRRQNVILLTVKNNRFKVLGKINNAKGISSGLYVANIDVDKKPEIVYLLKNGMLVVINIQDLLRSFVTFESVNIFISLIMNILVVLNAYFT